MKCNTRMGTVLVVTWLLVGCGGGDGTTTDDTTTDGTTTAGTSIVDASADVAERDTPAATARTAVGTVEIDGESWALVPSIQCGVYPGPVVFIAGHAEGDEAIEMVIDHDTETGIVGVRVENPGETPAWSAGREDLTFDISGKRVRGSGRFTSTAGSSVRMAEGKFDITC